MNAFLAPRRPRVRRSLLVILILAASAGAWLDAHAAAPATSKTILIENRTYTPLWYRTQGNSGFGKWIALLPGQRHAFNRWSKLKVETSLVGGVRKFTLTGGNTYYYDRAGEDRIGQKGAASFRTDPSDQGRGAWRRLKPPQMEYYTSHANSNAFAPLMEFMDEAEQYGDEYKLSLRDFALECYEAQQSGGTLPHDLRYMKGFTWFFGYIIDRAKNDVILLGLKDPTHPPLDVDCLATAIKAVHEGVVPGCSLDEHPDPSLQKSRVDGIPWNTRWASVMIDADYLMKKVCQGHESPRIPGMNSKWYYSYWRDRNNFQVGNSNSTNRFWFNFDNTRERSIASPGGELVVLYGNPVRVSSEFEVPGEGFGTGETAWDAVQFADDFTRNMDQLGQHYPSVGELLSLYRLYDVLFHLHQVGGVTPPAVEYWTDHYQRPYSGPPEGMPTLSRYGSYRWNYGSYVRTLQMSVKGGVSMKLAVDDATLRKASDASDGLLRRLVSASRPADE